MAAVTHTHRGHCQLCIRVQAIEPATGFIAKHGYVVPNGYFVGACPGSGQLSLHVERRVADIHIKEARARALRHAAHIADLQAGRLVPAQAWSGEYVRVQKTTKRNPTLYWVSERKMVPYADAPAAYREQALQAEIFEYENHQKQATDYADDLTTWAARIFDKQVPAYRVEELEPKEWTVGDVLRIGGKKGFNASIEAIEERDYRSNGFARGTTLIKTPHALVTYPARAEKRSKPNQFDPTGYIIEAARAERKVWEPLRTFKREQTALATELKEAGKL